MRTLYRIIDAVDTGVPTVNGHGYPAFRTGPFPTPPHPGAISHPSFSLTSGPIVPSSLLLPLLLPVNVPNVGAYLLSICLSVPLFLTVSRQCSPADKVKHPRRNKLSRP